MFQLPAVVCNSIVICVCPLIALAKDQCEGWNRRGSDIPARCFNHTCSWGEKDVVVSHLSAGSPMILYTTPESLSSCFELRNALKVRIVHTLCHRAHERPCLWSGHRAYVVRGFYSYG
jgi:superfamily II DNA helicase RecQ